MAEAVLHGTEARVERLERQVRLLIVVALLGFLVSLGALAWSLGAFTSSDPVARVTGRSFGILARDGELRAALASNDEGRPGLFMRDEDGEQRLLLDLSDDEEARVQLSDADGAPRLELQVSDETDAPIMVFRDRRGRARLTIGLDESGQGTLQLRDADGAVTWQQR